MLPGVQPYYYLGRWVEEIIKPSGTGLHSFPSVNFERYAMITVIFMSLFEFAVTGKLHGYISKKLKDIYGSAKRYGYDGLAIECAEILIKSGNGDHAMAEESERLMALHRYVPLVSFVESKELWEKKVEALFGVLALNKKTGSKTKSGSRLIWIVNLQKNHVELIPMEQK